MLADGVHIIADAVKETHLCVNASVDADYLLNTLSRFNASDVAGLLFFTNRITKKTCSVLNRFDEVFRYYNLPIVIVSKYAKELAASDFLKIKYSSLYILPIEDNSISDVELMNVLTIFMVYTGELYNLSSLDSKVEKSIVTHDSTFYREECMKLEDN